MLEILKSSSVSNVLNDQQSSHAVSVWYAESVDKKSNLQTLSETIVEGYTESATCKNISSFDIDFVNQRTLKYSTYYVY